MRKIELISNYINIDEKYIILILKTILFYIILQIIKKIVINLLKHLKDNKKEFIYIRNFKLITNITIIIMLLSLWGEHINKFITLISLVSAGITIALRDLIFNFFSGIYIKINKPFEIEDRIEINNYKGDIININPLSFELLEVNNETFIGQSTGIITHIPNSLIFSYPLRNYNKAFKYIWNEIKIKVPIDTDLKKTKNILYKIVNSNEIIKSIPPKMKNQINNITSDYRIYFNHYEPIIYTSIENNHIELTIRYLVHPKKARYVNSNLWNNIIKAYQNKEIILYQD